MKKRYFDKFIDEVKILNRIVHPNIVRIYNNYIDPNEQVGYIIIQKLESILVKYCLEDKILNNKDFVECFFGKVIKVKESSMEWNSFDDEYYEVHTIPTSLISQSIELLNNCNDKQKEIIKQNLQGRLEHYNADFSDLPF